VAAHELVLCLDRLGQHLEEAGGAHAFAVRRGPRVVRLGQQLFTRRWSAAPLDAVEDALHLVAAAEQIADPVEEAGELAAALPVERPRATAVSTCTTSKGFCR
jgi:hypothetical protein